MSVVTARAGRSLHTQTWARVVTALPLVMLFALFAGLYAWQGWRQRAPWIFFDEIFYTHDAQSVVGGADFTLDDSSPFRTLYGVLIAPAWLFDDPGRAYAVVKAIGAVTMSATVFPAYALARTVVPRRLALLAAAATCSIPALSYSSTVMEEVLAYPYATLTFLLITRALTVRSAGWIAGAAAASLLAPYVRGELVVLPAVLVASGALAFAGERWPGWSPARRLVAAASAVVAVALATVVLHAVSTNVQAAFDHPRRFLERGIWSAGVFTVGLGILPVIAGLAVVARPRGERPSRAVSSFVSVLVPSVVFFVLYTGGKGATAQWIYPILERNLIYLAPLLFTGTALVLARGRVRALAAAAATACAVGVALAPPIRIYAYPSADAPSLAVLTAARKGLGWGMHELRVGFVVAGILTLALLALLYAVRDRPGARSAVVAAVAVVVIGWNLTGELYAGDSAADFSDKLMATVAPPRDWVERATGGAPAAYVGQRTPRPSDVWLLAFWNPSLQQYLRLDRPPDHTAFRSIHVTRPDGTISADPRLHYVLADSGVQSAGRPVARKGGLTLYRVARPRVDSIVVGRYGDGWVGASARYDRFRSPTPGRLTVVFSRGTWCGPASTPGMLNVTVAPLRRDLTPGPKRAAMTANLRACGRRSITLPTPAGPFRASVGVSSTFVPDRAQPGSRDIRKLGALVDFSYRSD